MIPQGQESVWASWSDIPTASRASACRSWNMRKRVSHVLEHITDDRAAMRELRRILRPGGWAIVMVPIEHGRTTTYEDPSITTPEERERAYWQSDHVRLYAARRRRPADSRRVSRWASFHGRGTWPGCGRAPRTHTCRWGPVVSPFEGPGRRVGPTDLHGTLPTHTVVGHILPRAWAGATAGRGEPALRGHMGRRSRGRLIRGPPQRAASSNYVTWMRDRVLEMHRVLKETLWGS